VEVCPSEARQLVGRSMSVSDVLERVQKDVVFFDESGGGITISGGEPLMQAAFVEAVLEGCRDRKIRTVLDTCGYAASAAIWRIRKNVDIFLYDLKVMDDEKHRQFTGVGNNLILHNLEILAGCGSNVIVRLPVIPGVNDDAQNIDALVEFLTPLRIREVELLPYHRTGRDKYDRLHMRYQMQDVTPPTATQMQAIAERLNASGLSARIGG
jgi:pyruvate formate lyase activating enzyme